MTTQIISSGVTSYSLGVSGGDTLQIDGGGEVQTVKVLSGGFADVLAGGVVEYATVSGSLIGSGTLEGSYNYIYGRLSGLTVISGSTLVEDGAKAFGATVEDGGDLGGGGYMSGDVVRSGGELDIDYAASGSGNVVSGGGILEIQDGGVGHGDRVSSGGVEVLGFEAVASGEVISGGGTLLLANDITSGQSITTTASASASFSVDGATLEAGATLAVSGATVDYEARLTLAAGAAVADVDVLQGGTLIGPGRIGAVSDQGLVSGVAVASGGDLQVLSNGRLRSATAVDGGEITIASGGSGTSDVISSGGIEYLDYGAVISGETVLSGGTVVFAPVVSAGQTLLVTTSLSTASAVGGIALAAGADVQVWDGQVKSGGVMSVASGAAPAQASIAFGGHLYGPGSIDDAVVYGQVSGVTVLSSGGRLYVESGGAALADIVAGTEYVSAAGSTLHEQIQAGAVQSVYQGGFVSGDVISQGGSAFVSGAAVGGIVGGLELLYSVGRGAIINKTGDIELQSGVAIDEIDLGRLDVVSGVASDTMVGYGGAIYVDNGASASGTVVSAGGAEYLTGEAHGDIVLSGGALYYGAGLSAGQTFIYQSARVTSALALSGVTVSSGGDLYLDSMTVSNGAKLIVRSGGVASWTEVLSGGTLQVNSGAAADFGYVSSGGLLSGPGLIEGGVEVFGTASGETVVAGGAAYLNLGAKVLGITVSSAGWVDVVSSAFASGTIIASSGQLSVEFGGVASASVIRAGGYELDAGSQSHVTVSKGGRLDVAGWAIGVNLDGGVEDVEYNAVVSHNIVGAGGVVSTSNGAMTIGDVIMSGGTEAGYGSVSSAVVSSGGLLDMEPFAIADDDVIRSGGKLIWGGNVSGTLVERSVVTATTFLDGLTISSGATLVLDDVVVTSGATLSLAAGAPVTSAIVEAGGHLIGPGAVGFVLDYGLVSGVGTVGSATVAVSSGGVASGNVIHSGGSLTLSSGAVGKGDSIQSGAVEYLMSGATASGEVIHSGGALAFEKDVTSGQSITATGSETQWTWVEGVILSAGAALELSTATVDSGGVLTLAAGAPLTSAVTVSSGGKLLGPGAIVHAYVEGLVSGVAFASGGYLQVANGGVASGLVLGDASIVLFSSGTASGDIIGSGGWLDIGSDAVGSGDVIKSGGVVYVESGGIAKGEVVSSGGAGEFDLQITSGQTFDDPGVVSKTTIVEGVTLSSGAILRIGNATVLDGGTLTLGAGLTSGTAVTVSAGGTLKGPATVNDVNDLGTVSGIAIAASGYMGVQSGGVASGVSVASVGAWLLVESAGIVSATIVGAGGSAWVTSAGSAADVAVSSGGTLNVYSGAEILDGLTIQGGTVMLGGTMGAGQAVRFTGSAGLLQLENLAAFQAAISGLGAPAQQLDLGGFAYSAAETVSWAQSGTSGTLTVGDEGQSARLTLIGTYVTSDFQLTDDLSGGTLIDDDAEATNAKASPRGFAQAVAGFNGASGSHAVVPAQSGRTQLISASVLTVASSGR